MTEKKKRPPYKIKPQEILSLEEAEQLIKHLLVRGNQAKMAREIGKSTVSVANWIKDKEFPKYCGPYLEMINVRKLVK